MLLKVWLMCLIKSKDDAKVKKICDVLLDVESIDRSDLIDAFSNDEEFESLLKQAIDY